MPDSVSTKCIAEPKYKRVNREQRMQIRVLAAQQLPQTEIARILGVSQPTVSRWLTELAPLTDTRELAKQIANSRAAEAMDAAFDAAASGNSETALELLDRTEVLPKKQRDNGAHAGVQVIVCQPGQTAITAPVIDLSPPERQQLTE